MKTVYVFISKSRFFIDRVSGQLPMKHQPLQLRLRRFYLLRIHRPRRLPLCQMTDTIPALNARA
jgi:hypothetical protein